MILSIGIILFCGVLIGFLFERIKLPKLIGYLIIGILLGSSVFNILDKSIYLISSDLRMIALVIILTRAGLSLDLKKIKESGLSAILMCFVPASMEIIAVAIFGPIILGLSLFESLLLGAVLGAVSPAIVVPRMIKLKNEKYGEKKGVPNLLLAGSSLDDIYTIVMFYAFLGLVQTNSINAMTFLNIPISIISGCILGFIVGVLSVVILKKINIPTIVVTILTLSISLLMIYMENVLETYISISALLGIMVYSQIIARKLPSKAKELEKQYNYLWFLFEIFLFVLVGAELKLSSAMDNGLSAIFLLMISLLFRSIGVIICTLFSKYNFKERLFCIIAYLPKATVQASIGGIALSIGLPSGDIILTVAVITILISAPLGSLLTDLLYKKLLERDVDNEASSVIDDTLSSNL
jgi:NhaP-type Na+/H+ or K+/H+ antiporter